MKFIVGMCVLLVSLKAFSQGNSKRPYNEIIKFEQTNNRANGDLDRQMSDLFWTYVVAHKYLLDFDYMIGVGGISPYGASTEEKARLDQLKADFAANSNIEVIFQSDTYKNLQKLRIISETLEEEIAEKYLNAVGEVFKIQLKKERYPEVGKVFPAEDEQKLQDHVNFILSVKGLFGADIETLKQNEALRVQVAVLDSLKKIQTEMSEELKIPSRVTPRTSREALAKRDARIQEIGYMAKDLDLTVEQTTEYGEKYISFLRREAAAMRWQRRELDSYIREELSTYMIHRTQFEGIPSTRRTSIQEIMDGMQLALREGIDRYPNSSLFEPGVGRKGNIYGRRFPTNVFALTYDDGPNSGSSKRILDLLVEHNVKATWFMLTKMAKHYKSTAEEIRDMGMEVASHSYSHINFLKSSISMDTKKYEINTAVDHLEGALDVEVEYFRFPYGNGTNNSVYRKMVADRNLIHVNWNVDSLDWKDRNPTSVFNRVITQMGKVKRGVLLFHDVHNSTFTASKLLLEHLKTKPEIKLCTVGSIINEMETGVDCRSSSDEPMDISSSVERDLNDLCEVFNKRVNSVWGAVRPVLGGNPNQSSNSCISGSAWHSHSTPRSDERRIEQLLLMERKYQRLNESDSRIYVDSDIKKILDQIFNNDDDLEDRFCEISYDRNNPRKIVDLSHVYRSVKRRKLSFNPHDNVNLRWGIEDGSPSRCTLDSNSSYYGYTSL